MCEEESGGRNCQSVFYIKSLNLNSQCGIIRASCSLCGVAGLFWTRVNTPWFANLKPSPLFYYLSFSAVMRHTEAFWNKCGWFCVCVFNHTKYEVFLKVYWNSVFSSVVYYASKELLVCFYHVLWKNRDTVQIFHGNCLIWSSLCFTQ